MFFPEGNKMEEEKRHAGRDGGERGWGGGYSQIDCSRCSGAHAVE